MEDVSAFSDCDIYVYGRKRAELTGIGEVISFSDINVTLACDSGSISVDGSSLRIESFDSASGKLTVNGCIDGVFYFGDGLNGRKKRKLFG